MAGHICRITKLIWAPRSLPETAVATPFWLALCVGGACGVVIGSVTLLVSTAGMDEPYLTVRDYFRDVLCTLANPFLALFGAGAYTFYGSCVTFSLRIGASRRRRLSVAHLVAILLASVCLVVPAVVWTPVALVAQLSSPTLGIAAGVPGWMQAWPIRLAGSLWWVPIALGASMAHLFWTGRKLNALCSDPDAHLCARCGYDVRGLPSAVCPECGLANAAD